MRAVVLTLLLLPALLWSCGSDVTTFGDGGSTADGGSTSTTSEGGTTSTTSDGGAGGEGAGGPACDTFDQPCTTCLATEEACQDLYCDCLANPDCAGFWQCALQCDQDPDCFDTCELNNSAGYADFWKVRDCMGTDCSDACMGVPPLGGCFNCLLDVCEDPLEACQGDPDCNAYLDCNAACSDFACITGCYAAVPDSTLVNDLLNCNNTECTSECQGLPCQGFGDSCTDCAVASPTCTAAYCACTGDTTCLGLSGCYNGCMPGDEPCIDACEATWFNGYGEYLLMLDCMGSDCSADCNNVNPLNTCVVCLATDCEAELEGCIGDADCNEYLDCTQACTNPNCENACYALANDTSAIDALGVCLTTTCSGDCS